MEIIVATFDLHNYPSRNANLTSSRKDFPVDKTESSIFGWLTPPAILKEWWYFWTNGIDAYSLVGDIGKSRLGGGRRRSVKDFDRNLRSPG
jgi:hypothetical protein